VHGRVQQELLAGWACWRRHHWGGGASGGGGEGAVAVIAATPVVKGSFKSIF